jgi:hypothetical protein
VCGVPVISVSSRKLPTQWMHLEITLCYSVSSRIYLPNLPLKGFDLAACHDSPKPIA